jgi:hypothetical protein
LKHAEPALAKGFLEQRLTEEHPVLADCQTAWFESIATIQGEIQKSLRTSVPPFVLSTCDRLQHATPQQILSSICITESALRDEIEQPAPECRANIERLRLIALQKHTKYAPRRDQIHARLKRIVMDTEFERIEAVYPKEKFMQVLYFTLRLRLFDYVLDESSEEKLKPLGRALPLLPEFWQIKLAALQAAAPLLTRTDRQVLLQALSQPRLFRRQPRLPGTEALARLLSGYVWIWTGPRPKLLEEALHRQVSGAGQWEDILPLLAQLICDALRLTDIKDDRIYRLSHDDIKAFYKNSQEILSSLSFVDGHVRAVSEKEMAADCVWAQLEAEAAQEDHLARVAQEQVQRAVQERLRQFQALTASSVAPGAPLAPDMAVAQLSFGYVTNWGSSAPRTEDFQCVAQEEALAAMLAPILDRHNCQVSVPCSSLARAVLHYLIETPDEVKLLYPKEFVGNCHWHKIKRQNARIYLRMREKRCLIYIMHRKNWQHDALLTGRF